MSKVAIDDTKIVLFFLDIAEKWHEAAHGPTRPELRYMMTPFEECRADTCVTAHEFFALLDGYEKKQSCPPSGAPLRHGTR